MCWISPSPAWLRTGNGLQTERLTSHSTGTPRDAFGGGGDCTVNQPYTSATFNSFRFVPYGAVELDVKCSGAYIRQGIWDLTFCAVHDVQGNIRSIFLDSLPAHAVCLPLFCVQRVVVYEIYRYLFALAATRVF